MSSTSSSLPLSVLLRPGLYLKRWLLLLLAGMLLLCLGGAYLLVVLYREGQFPDWVTTVTLQFLPLWARGVILLVVGLAMGLVAAAGLYRSTATVVLARGRGGETLMEMIYEYRLRRGGPRVVCVGGGTGMPTVLRGLKNHTAHITAIVTVGDDGGSSGRLRREHGIIPPGDFRNNIVALAEVEPLMSRLLQYRFPPGSSLEGHSFGNLFVLAMAGITGNFEQALRETSRVLAVKGTILPSTLEDVTIGAEFMDGTEVRGESQIPEMHRSIRRLFLEPEHPSAQPEAVAAILEADLVVLGPGSLYTSLLPNLLVEGIAKALEQTEALTVYVCNVATQPGETDGYDAMAHVDAIVRHLPGKTNPLDVVLVNTTRCPPSEIGEGVALVQVGSRERPRWPKFELEDLGRDDLPLRHDPEKLGRALIRIFNQNRATRPQ